jgi:hypothetical protein
MITDLFTGISGLDADVVTGAVPPTCRRPPSSPRVTAVGDSELLLEFPEWRPRVSARHLVPSLSVLTERRYSVRFELSTCSAASWSPWVATATLGPGRFPVLPAMTDGLACEVDVYTAASAEQVKLRIRVGATDPHAVLAAPWIATLSASDRGPLAPAGTDGTASLLLVPARSQRDAPPELAPRICSPTSVGMVLEYWGRPAATPSLAAEIFHPATDSYGVWPAAIQAAGRRGVAGYLLRFPDWPTAAWCLERALPIIASIRYEAGELTDAAIVETSGHLVVITGWRGEDVFVNDPAGPTAASVPRRYRLDEFQRAWLERTGVGFVLFRPDRSMSRDASGVRVPGEPRGGGDD